METTCIYLNNLKFFAFPDFIFYQNISSIWRPTTFPNLQHRVALFLICFVFTTTIRVQLSFTIDLPQVARTWSCSWKYNNVPTLIWLACWPFLPNFRSAEWAQIWSCIVKKIFYCQFTVKSTGNFVAKKVL